jgi:hypothetical protein
MSACSFNLFYCITAEILKNSFINASMTTLPNFGLLLKDADVVRKWFLKAACGHWPRTRVSETAGFDFTVIHFPAVSETSKCGY